MADTAVPDEIHRRRWWILAVLCLSLLLIVAGNSSLNVALPDIQKALGSSPSQLQWMVNIYSMVFAVLLLPAGALADRFGRKTALQVGLVVFALASLAATYATDNWQVIVLRAGTGMGAAFIMPGTLSILMNVFPDHVERQKAIAIWAGCAGLGGAVGPVVTGVLLAHYPWGSVFFINVVICAVALAAGAVLLPNSSDPHEAILDPVGVLLAVGAIGGLLYGINEGPESGWTSPAIMGTIGAGLALMGVFVWWELRNPHAMLDMRLFKIRAFSVGSTTISLQFFAMYGLYFAVAQYLQISHGYSPLRTAVACLPIGMVGMVAAPMSAVFVRRFGHRTVVGSGLILSALGLLIMGDASPTTSYLLLFVGFVMMGFGNGQTTAPSTTLIMSSVPRAKSGVGSAVNDLSRELGGALGIAVLGSVMSSVYRGSIGTNLGSSDLVAKAGSAIDVTLRAAGAAGPASADGRALFHAAQTTFAHGFGVAMLLGAGVLVANSLLVWVRAIAVGPNEAGVAQPAGRH
ncbi:MAG: MFS transporter [Microthrixaceae bacterium]